MNAYRKIFSGSLFSRFHNPVCISTIPTRNVGAYEGHGRTVLDFRDKKDTDFHLISAYSQVGFRLQNGIFVVGPMIIHENTVLGWNIKDDQAITEDSLEFFRHVVPPLDLLILGLSEDKSLKSFNRDLIIQFKKLNLPLEILSSTRACQMYNFVVGTRNVAGAFLPPRRFRILSEDYVDNMRRHKMQLGPDYQDMYEGVIERQAREMGIKDR